MNAEEKLYKVRVSPVKMFNKIIKASSDLPRVKEFFKNTSNIGSLDANWNGLHLIQHA